jgi:hypothetical protein
MNVAARDSSDDFTLILGDHCYRSRSSFARLLPLHVSRIEGVDEMIEEIRIDIEDPDELFYVMLTDAGGSTTLVDSKH